MGFLDSIRNIFSGSRKNASEKAFTNLTEGKNINFSPKSDRYTFGRRFDTQYDKVWKPKTAEEKKTLSPEGYFRIGERQNERDKVYTSIFDAAKERAKAIDEERVRQLKESGQKARRTQKRTLEKKAKEEADKAIQSEENREKQISIPSTAIAKIKYNPHNEILKVKFTSGNKEYTYRPGVPEDLIRRWLEAPSKGEFFMRNIHDQYSLFGKNHRKKTKSEVKGIMRYARAAAKNKNRHGGDSITTKGVKFLNV